MSISSVGSSPVLQWLQSYLSGAGSSKGSASSCGCQPSGDTASISQEAAQLNANQVSQVSDSSQPSGAVGTQGRHHHHHHRGEQDGGSFVDRLAESILSDLQQATENGGSPEAGSATPASVSSSATGDSFIDKLAQSIANDLLSKYQQATGASVSSSQPSATSQVNVIA